jgi:hypothetical protein
LGVPLLRYLPCHQRFKPKAWVNCRRTMTTMLTQGLMTRGAGAPFEVSPVGAVVEGGLGEASQL